MEIHRRDPNSAWVKYESAWCLLDTRDGPLGDWEIALALHYLGLNELDIEEPEDLILRTVWFDDTNGGIHLFYDLLMDRTTRDQEWRDQRLAEVRTALEQEYAVVPWHGQIVTYELRPITTSFVSDHFTRYGSEWWRDHLRGSTR
jgi:hypothetical protein